MKVPFFRPSITDAEVAEVVDCLRSGWLTTGPRTKQFEANLANAVGGKHAIALNSCTAALHLAVEALGLVANQAVLVPTMTFAATAEVVRYLGAIPILVDCDPVTRNMDLSDAEQKIADYHAGKLPGMPASRGKIVGVMPVHVGGYMMDTDAIADFARKHRLWIVEDAAHALPAAWRKGAEQPWRRCGEHTANVTCYSFYANKTITTGEGGMAVTDDDALADRMRIMSLHGLSRDAWNRYADGGKWDYAIIAPGYKYNLTDVASAIGLVQLRRAEELRVERQRLAAEFTKALADVPEVTAPISCDNRIHSWHLYPIELSLEQLTIDRDVFVEKMREHGVAFSVHWRPLHQHPYYIETFGWKPEHCPVATRVWRRLVTLPLFPGLRSDEQQHIVQTIRDLCQRHRV